MTTRTKSVQPKRTSMGIPAPRVSKRTGETYTPPYARITRRGELELWECHHVPARDILNRHEVPSSSSTNVVYIVSERVTTSLDGHSSGELEIARWDCGCPAYDLARQKDGPMASCKHIVSVGAQVQAEHQAEMRAMLDRKLAGWAQMGALSAVTAMSDMYDSDEITRNAG